MIFILMNLEFTCGFNNLLVVYLRESFGLLDFVHGGLII